MGIVIETAEHGLALAQPAQQLGSGQVDGADGAFRLLGIQLGGL